MSNPSTRALDTYIHLTNTAAITALVRSALQSGLVDGLRSGQKTLEQLADATGISADRLQLLLNGLVHTGIVEKYGDDYALAQFGHLIPEDQKDLGDRYWRHLNDWIREGKTIPENEATDLDASDFVRETLANEWMVTPALMAAVEKLRLERREDPWDVLEIGCDGAILTSTILFQNPAARATLVDDASGLARARRTVESIEGSDRVEYLENAPGEMQFPSGPFELVVIANRLHRERPETVQQIFHLLYDRVDPGGEILIVDYFAGVPGGSLSFALLEIQLAFRFPQGRLYTVEQMTAWLDQAGFTNAKYEPLDVSPRVFGMILAQRPKIVTRDH